MMESKVCLLLLCVFLCVACYYDYRFCRIPNWLVCMVFGLGTVSAVMTGGLMMLSHYVICGALLVILFYPLFRIGVIGGGDVKLYGVCCGFFAEDKILMFLFFSLLVAAIFSLIHFIRRADFRERITYLFSYVKGVADSGRWVLYWNDLREKRRSGVCLAGPILISVLIMCLYC